MTKATRNAVFLFLCAVTAFSMDAQTVRTSAGAAQTGAGAKTQLVTTENAVNWGTEEIHSTAMLDTKAAGIILPDGRESVYQIMRRNLPELTAPVIFSLPVDSATTLGELITSGDITLPEIQEIIDSGKKTTPWFSLDLKTATMTNTLSLSQLRELFVKHHTAYTPKKPLNAVPTRTYSGIVIDARGELPVHGEYTSSKLTPAMFPKVRSTLMKLVYERNMVEPAIAAQTGIVSYAAAPASWQIGAENADAGTGEETGGRRRSAIARGEAAAARAGGEGNPARTAGTEIAGSDPLYIKAVGVYGIFRTDPVISERDYLRIFCDDGNLELLRQGKVVILCDEDMLVKTEFERPKNDDFYFVRREIERRLEEAGIEGVNVAGRKNGMKLTLYGIRFVADSAEILPEEEDRIYEIARALASTDPRTRFIIEGHTASVGKPSGEMQLSRERAQSIAAWLITAGIDASRIETEGFGGTRPIAPNDSEENRAQNRRVEITSIFE